MKVARNCKRDRKDKIDGPPSSGRKIIRLNKRTSKPAVDESALYSREHIWVRMEDRQAVVGISERVLDQFGQLLLVELPEPEEHLCQRAIFGMAISLKSAFELYMPISGKVVAVNMALEKAPEQVNKQPYTRGWMIRIEPDDPSDLNHLYSFDAYRSMQSTSDWRVEQMDSMAAT